MEKSLIILINWNSGKLTSECIESLKKSSDQRFELCVIDNGSTDGSLQYIENETNIKIIKNIKNEGFCKANNQGIQYGIENGYDIIILLNNDIIVDPEWHKKLRNYFLENNNIGVLGSKILFRQYKDLINSTGVLCNLNGYCWDQDFGELDRPEVGLSEVFAVSGGALAFRTSDVKNVGFLDEDYFAYYEDVEFSCRFRRVAGKKILTANDCIVFHEYSASSSKMPVFKYYLAVRNYWMNISKIFSTQFIMKNIHRLIFQRLKNEFRNRLKEKSFRYLWIEITSLAKFPFFIIKNIDKRPSQKQFKEYFHLLNQNKGAPSINLVNIERRTSAKWTKG